MRQLWLLLTLSLCMPAQAITKCELDNKHILYTNGLCPANAKTQLFVNHHYVDQKVLEQQQQQRAQKLDKAFDKARDRDKPRLNSSTPNQP